MQKLFSVGHPKEEHIPVLKKLWADVFGDDEAVIDNFFNETAKYENIVCAFCDNEPVSVLYAVESAVFLKNKEYKAYYIYSVCTHPNCRGNNLSARALEFLEKISNERGISYLFLVPAEESLFKMYEELGFKTGFTYKAECFSKDDFSEYKGKLSSLSYEEYKKYRSFSGKIPYAVMKETGFNSFYNPVKNNINCISVNAEGFAVYECENGKVTVFELFGNENLLLSAIFKLTKAPCVTVHKYAVENGIPYGMVKSIDGSELFENGFLGVPYGG